MAEVFQLSLPGPAGSAAPPVHPTLVKTRTSLVLFDMGYPGQVDDIDRELHRNGFALGDLSHIVISHQDHDHIGSLADIKRRNPAVIVLASAAEEPFISGKEESLRIRQARDFNRTLRGDEREWGESFLRYLSTIEPCEVDRVVARFPESIDGEITVIPTPGHTPGHISAHLERLKTLIVGDALAIENGSLVIANPQFTLDPPTCRRTILYIAELNLEWLYCYHGGVVRTEDGKALGALIDSFGD